MKTSCKRKSLFLSILLSVSFVFCAGLVDAQQKPIKAAVMSGFTGPGATISKRLFQGTKLAVDEINVRGGILGRQIELTAEDDEANPTKAVIVAKKLVERDKIDAIFGPAFTAIAVATTPMFTEGKVLQFISGTGVPLDASKYPYLFRVAFGTEEQAQIIVDYSLDYLKKTKIGLIGDSTALGRNGAEDIKKVLRKRGMEPVGSEFFNVGDMDITGQLKRLRDRGSEVLVLYGVGPDVANVLRGRKTMGWNVPIVGHIALALKGLLDLVGPELSENVYAVMYKNFALSDKVKLPEKTNNFRENFLKAGGESNEGLFLPAQYYDSVYVYKYGIEKAGTTDSTKVRDVLEHTQDLKVLLGTCKFHPGNHSGLWPEDMTLVEIRTFENGIHKKAPYAP